MHDSWITVMDSCLSSGLTNLVNTCFANTTLQTILHIPLLQEYINKHKECSKNCYCQYLASYPGFRDFYRESSGTRLCQYHNDINVLLIRLCCICLRKRLKNFCM